MPRASPAARVRKPTGTRAANQRPGGSVEREPPPRAASDVRRRSLWRIRRSVSCTVAGGVLPARLLCGHFRLGFQRRAPVSSALPAARCERALSLPSLPPREGSYLWWRGLARTRTPPLRQDGCCLCRRRRRPRLSFGTVARRRLPKPFPCEARLPARGSARGRDSAAGQGCDRLGPPGPPPSAEPRALP